MVGTSQAQSPSAAASAPTVREGLMAPLQSAQSLIAAKRFDEALAQVRLAEAVADRSPYETPGSLTRERVVAWREMGINRVSLGVQSFVEREIRRTGRKHSAAIVEADVALLRECGIESINLDLIAGLAEQTRESWEESVDQVIRLGVPHVSVYILEVDEDSRLGAEVLLNGKRYGAAGYSE